jgi:hypothetical protein
LVFKSIPSADWSCTSPNHEKQLTISVIGILSLKVLQLGVGEEAIGEKRRFVLFYPSRFSEISSYPRLWLKFWNYVELGTMWSRGDVAIHI